MIAPMNDTANGPTPPKILSPPGTGTPKRRAGLALAGLALAFAAFYLPWLTWVEDGGAYGPRHANISGGELAHAVWTEYRNTYDGIEERVMEAQSADPDEVSEAEYLNTPTLRHASWSAAVGLWLPLAGAVLGLTGYFVFAGLGRWSLVRQWVWGISVFAVVMGGLALWGRLDHSSALELNGQPVWWSGGLAAGAPGVAGAERVFPLAGCGVWIGLAGWILAAAGCRWLKPEWRPPTFSFAKHAPVLSLAILVVASTFLSDAFPKTQNLLNIFRQVSFTGIIALGMTFVIIGGGIDLSVGSMTALTGASVLAAVNWGVGAGVDGWTVVALGAAAGLAAGVVLGAVNGLLVTAGKMAPFIATLGTMAVFRSLALRWGDAGEFRSDSALLGQVGMGGWLPLGGWPPGLDAGGKAGYFLTPATGNNLFIPLPVWVMVLAAGMFALLLGWTRFGRHLCAVGSNERVARYAGVRVWLVRMYTYVLAGLTVGLSGFLFSARFNSLSTTTAGANYELDAIAAVIMGGTPLSGGRGTVWGTVVGALLLGIINNMLNMMGVSAYWQGTVKGLAILAAVLVQRRRE